MLELRLSFERGIVKDRGGPESISANELNVFFVQFVHLGIPLPSLLDNGCGTTFTKKLETEL
jgi:hypothetical protein